jgi:hypothetical protein
MCVVFVWHVIQPETVLLNSKFYSKVHSYNKTLDYVLVVWFLKF